MNNRNGSSPRPLRRPAFTLIEMMITVIIILLVVATVLPSAIGLFKAGADAQAKNMFSAQLAAARSLAIVRGTYAGVHVQMVDNPGKFYEKARGKCFTAVVEYHPDPPTVTPGPAQGTFTLAEGYQPRQVPGTFAFGEISLAHVAGGTTYQNLTNGALADAFRCFTIVFSPTGEIVKFPNQDRIKFDDAAGNNRNAALSSIFDVTASTSPAKLWDMAMAGGATGEAGVSAVVMFDNAIFEELADNDPDRNAFLQTSGLLLPANVYTGQLFESE